MPVSSVIICAQLSDLTASPFALTIDGDRVRLAVDGVVVSGVFQGALVALTFPVTGDKTADAGHRDTCTRVEEAISAGGGSFMKSGLWGVFSLNDWLHRLNAKRAGRSDAFLLYGWDNYDSFRPFAA